jgi:hypothetical protein
MYNLPGPFALQDALKGQDNVGLLTIPNLGDREPNAVSDLIPSPIINFSNSVGFDNWDFK